MGKTLFQKIMDGESPLPEVAQTLGGKIKDVAPAKGTISMRYTITSGFANPMGYVQGGILAAMLDDTMSLALLATLAENEFAPSLELKINFISPALPGFFEGSGTVISKGNRVCVLEGDLWQDGNRVARSSATALINKKMGNGNKLPHHGK